MSLNKKQKEEYYNKILEKCRKRQAKIDVLLNRKPEKKEKKVSVPKTVDWDKLNKFVGKKETPPYVSDNFQIGPDGAYEHEED